MNERHERQLELPFTAEQVNRLIGAIERNTNATAQLVQTMQTKNARKRVRARNVPVVAEKPMLVTPLAKAAAQRALARVGIRS